MALRMICGGEVGFNSCTLSKELVLKELPDTSSTTISGDLSTLVVPSPPPPPPFPLLRADFTEPPDPSLATPPSFQSNPRVGVIVPSLLPRPFLDGWGLLLDCRGGRGSSEHSDSPPVMSSRDDDLRRGVAHSDWTLLLPLSLESCPLSGKMLEIGDCIAPQGKGCLFSRPPAPERGVASWAESKFPVFPWLALRGVCVLLLGGPLNGEDSPISESRLEVPGMGPARGV